MRYIRYYLALSAIFFVADACAMEEKYVESMQKVQMPKGNPEDLMSLWYDGKTMKYVTVKRNILESTLQACYELGDADSYSIYALVLLHSRALGTPMHNKCAEFVKKNAIRFDRMLKDKKLVNEDGYIDNDVKNIGRIAIQVLPTEVYVKHPSNFWPAHGQRKPVEQKKKSQEDHEDAEYGCVEFKDGSKQIIKKDDTN